MPPNGANISIVSPIFKLDDEIWDLGADKFRWSSEHRVAAVKGYNLWGCWHVVNIFCLWERYESLEARRQTLVDRIIV